jgi:hypothetical protein
VPYPEDKEMIDYLINIVFAASTYWGVAASLFVMYKFLPWDKFSEDIAKQRVWTKNASIVLFVIGVFVGITSPSNTYKNTVDYNKNQDLYRIQQLNESQQNRAPEVVDISRQPQTTEQRAAASIDMRQRVNTTEPQ